MDPQNIMELFNNLRNDEFLRILITRNDVTINIDKKDTVNIRNGVLNITRLSGRKLLIDPQYILMASVLPYHHKF